VRQHETGIGQLDTDLPGGHQAKKHPLLPDRPALLARAGTHTRTQSARGRLLAYPGQDRRGDLPQAGSASPIQRQCAQRFTSGKERPHPLLQRGSNCTHGEGDLSGPRQRTGHQRPLEGHPTFQLHRLVVKVAHGQNSAHRGRGKQRVCLIQHLPRHCDDSRRGAGRVIDALPPQDVRHVERGAKIGDGSHQRQLAPARRRASSAWISWCRVRVSG
jgi:hypothetical protein